MACRARRPRQPSRNFSTTANFRDTAAAPNFFETLIEAARNPEGIGFTWCNDTRYAVMASLGIVEMGAIVTRG
jgi:hypothetical protein